MATAMESALDVLLDGITDRLIARGYVVQVPVQGPPAGLGADYDAATCQAFVDPQHMGDNVLERAAVFFGELAQNGEISSTDLVAKLNLKGATSISAALTNTLKKGARRLGLAPPWTPAATTDGTRTVWRDRNGIAARMEVAIEAERRRRGLLP